MNRLQSFVLASLLLASVTLTAQQREFADPVMVYYMPFTQLKVTVEYDRIVETVGPFYQYAERYLAAKEIVKKDATRYEMTAVKTLIHTTVDHSKAYVVTPQKGFNARLLAFTTSGLLRGYNLPTVKPNDNARSKTNVKLPEDPGIPVAYPVMPLLEEQLIASSIAKMAEGTAKQIYRLREARLNILAGDVDQLPADGRALQLTLDEISKREAELVALFVGTRQVEHLTKTYVYTPSRDEEQTTLLRFSRLLGPVANDDLSGEAIILKQHITMPDYPAESKKVTELVSPIYYNLPAEMTFTITRKNQLYAQGTIPVAQFGLRIPIAADLIDDKISIFLNTLTGAIETVQR